MADVQGRIEKVAFDVVRFMDGSEDIDKLWRIHKEDDGNEFIVAMYEDGSLQTSSEHKNTEKTAWHAATNKTASHITVFYKGEPITKVAAADIGADADEASALCKHLPQRLASERRLVTALLQDLSDDERQALKDRHPELLG